MSERVAIITGAGKGIGRAVARELMQRGFKLVLTARTLQDLHETASDARDANDVKVVAGDVSKPEHVQRVVDEAMSAFGRVDVVVNNAGFAPLRLIEELSIEDWQRVVDVNLSATFYFCKAVWPIFRRQGGGVIVNISSASSRDPFKGLAAYGAAKAGVNLLGWSLAREGEEFGIRVYTIAPAAVETQMLRGIVSKEQYPPANALEPAEVARVALACIDGDLRHTSGEVIHLHKRLG